MGSPDGAAPPSVDSPAGWSAVVAASDEDGELSADEFEDDDPSELLAQPDMISPAAAIIATVIDLIRERLLIEVLLLKVREGTAANSAADAAKRDVQIHRGLDGKIGDSHMGLFGASQWIHRHSMIKHLPVHRGSSRSQW
jgi:hypothetical protein